MRTYLQAVAFLKAARLHQKLRQSDLEAKAGLGQGYISILERGANVASSETLLRWCNALGVNPFAEDEQQIRADERDKIAFYIVAELVCCDIHARLEAEAAKGHWDGVTHQWVMPQSWRDLKKSPDYHPICHYGGWAASLAYHGPQLDGRYDGWRRGILFEPENPKGKAECKPTYYCPTAGEYESPCHGGFDVCCSNPELHTPSSETP